MNFSETRFHRRVPGLKAQAAKLRLLVKDFLYEVIDGELVGRGTLQPHALCETYAFQIRYRVNKTPSIEILQPKLRTRPDQPKIPHTYGEDRPCAFRPQIDWSAEMYLADTVVPWLALWLFFYEVWLATGEWLGGGEHPEIDEDF